MNTSEVLRNTLKQHRFNPNPGHFNEKCSGCSWIGWEHDRHVAMELALALKNARWITSVEQLRAITPVPGAGGAIIKSFACQSDTGDVYERLPGGEWFDLYNEVTSSPEEIALPVMLIWEPGQ